MSIRIVPQEERWAHEYLFHSHVEETSKAERSTLRGKILPFLEESGEPDENGNLTWEFPEPVSIEGKKFRGLMLQRRVSEYTDEDKALELIYKHDLQRRCIKERIVEDVDLDELYAANQEGIVSDDEIDSIIETTESWALTKVKA